jgi:hypothetical protein
LAGLIGRFGAIDPTDRGRTQRYSLSADGWRQAGAGRLRASAFGVEHALDPVSNFTYAPDPRRGDQFEPLERRHFDGGTVDDDQGLSLWGRQGPFRGGLKVRADDIRPLALFRTTGGPRYATVRQDGVDEASCVHPLEPRTLRLTATLQLQ